MKEQVGAARICQSLLMCHLDKLLGVNLYVLEIFPLVARVRGAITLSTWAGAAPVRQAK